MGSLGRPFTCSISTAFLYPCLLSNEMCTVAFRGSRLAACSVYLAGAARCDITNRTGAVNKSSTSRDRATQHSGREAEDPTSQSSSRFPSISIAYDDLSTNPGLSISYQHCGNLPERPGLLRIAITRPISVHTPSFPHLYLHPNNPSSPHNNLSFNVISTLAGGLRLP